jgi:regulator of sirC expression with transglutaminase-like and TPR domain
MTAACDGRMLAAREHIGLDRSREVDVTPLEPLLRFSAFAARPDERLGLAEGALLIAEIAYPGLAPVRSLRTLDRLAAEVRRELSLPPNGRLDAALAAERQMATHVLRGMRDVLAGREGFHGNRDEYDDPRNSFLNDVLDRRTGLPILLSVIYLEVARRLGAPLAGVSLPAHFVTTWPLEASEGGALFFDAFSGEILDAAACRRFVIRLMSASPGGPMVDARWFAPVGTRAILTRMLHNLKRVYLERGDTSAALEVVERLIVLRPDLPEELRDRGLLRLALGDPLLAAADIAAYTERAPNAPEVRRLGKRLAEAREVRAKLN